MEREVKSPFGRTIYPSRTDSSPKKPRVGTEEPGQHIHNLAPGGRICRKCGLLVYKGKAI